MLQPSGLKPARHDRIAGVTGRTCIVQRTAAAATTGMIIQSSRRGGIALLHLAAHVALRTSLRSQFSRSKFQQSLHKHKHKQKQPKINSIKKNPEPIIHIITKPPKPKQITDLNEVLLTMRGKVEFK